MKIQELKHSQIFRVNKELEQTLTLAFTSRGHRAPAWPSVLQIHSEGSFSSAYVVSPMPGFPATKASWFGDIDVVPLQDNELTFEEQFLIRCQGRVNTHTGWDPEIFVVDAEEQVIPAFQFLPTKQAPFQHTASTTGGSTSGNFATLYEDGFQAEFRTPPNTCHGYGMDAIRSGLEGILNTARKHNPAAKLTLKNLFRLPSVQLATASDEHVSFGCMPSKNAYGLAPLVFEDARSIPYRCAGGHVHFGSGKMMEVLKTNADLVVQNLDRYAGLPCVALFAGIDDPRRRQFYGRAGEYRLPIHGLEYRVLSNAWMSHPAVAHLVNNTVRGALRLLDMPSSKDDLSAQDVQDIINTCDVKAAQKWIKANWGLMKQFLTKELGGNETAVERSKGLWLTGIKKSIPNYDDIENNWRLNQNWMGHTDNSAGTWASYSYNGNLAA